MQPYPGLISVVPAGLSIAALRAENKWNYSSFSAEQHQTINIEGKGGPPEGGAPSEEANRGIKIIEKILGYCLTKAGDGRNRFY